MRRIVWENTHKAIIHVDLKVPVSPIMDPKRQNRARDLVCVSGGSHPEAELEAKEFGVEVPGVLFRPVGGPELYLIFKLLKICLEPGLSLSRVTACAVFLV